jgi:hypothetical protein
LQILGVAASTATQPLQVDGGSLSVRSDLLQPFATAQHAALRLSENRHCMHNAALRSTQRLDGEDVRP